MPMSMRYIDLPCTSLTKTKFTLKVTIPTVHFLFSCSSFADTYNTAPATAPPAQMVAAASTAAADILPWQSKAMMVMSN